MENPRPPLVIAELSTARLILRLGPIEEVVAGSDGSRETMTTMSVIDELLDNNRRYAETFVGMVPIRPAKRLAVVACMDSRIDVHGILGLGVGDAHVIRNAGGVISPDVIRSLTISQRVTGTREIVLIHHTDCANLGLDEMAFKAKLQAEVGFKPDWSFDSFTDLEEDLRQSVLRLRSNPFIAYTDKIRGFIFDVATGKLAEVV